jgi:hypothetical protein
MQRIVKERRRGKMEKENFDLTLKVKMPGAWRGYYYCKGKYPTSEETLNEHLEKCNYCRGKHEEYENGRWRRSI